MDCVASLPPCEDHNVRGSPEIDNEALNRESHHAMRFSPTVIARFDRVLTDFSERHEIGGSSNCILIRARQAARIALAEQAKAKTLPAALSLIKTMHERLSDRIIYASDSQLWPTFAIRQAAYKAGVTGHNAMASRGD